MIKRAFLIGLSAFLLSACSKNNDSKTLRFRYWGDTEEIKIISAMIRDFEKAHPGVKIKDERKPAGASQYSEVLMNEFAAGDAPDVIFAVAEIKDLLAENNLLQSLEPFLKDDQELKKATTIPH